MHDVLVNAAIWCYVVSALSIVCLVLIGGFIPPDKVIAFYKDATGKINRRFFK